ncbi:conserved hypothetical protein [Microcystis aeruginosa NIES-298]|uniref:DUF29 domain-containing protein n=6 Tax=Microcystis aeruginosa TaxID=1126 RepID=I4HMJ4_MICAE|nr:conserved hypothetical protein [Microcystis aeruginosa NIES-298]CCI23268.1 conserved hypothetical protein [Microcystis aeruginosa PCC 9808]
MGLINIESRLVFTCGSSVMTRSTETATPTLYEEDFYLWLKTTAEQLKKGQFAEVDLDNLIEEIESMGRSERHALKSLLTRLLEHLLKLTYWQSERDRNGNHWNGEINNFRAEIQDLLEDSPSLKPYLREIFEPSYHTALEAVRKKMGLSPGGLPSQIIFNLEQVLDHQWLPIDWE